MIEQPPQITQNGEKSEYPISSSLVSSEIRDMIGLLSDLQNKRQVYMNDQSLRSLSQAKFHF